VISGSACGSRNVRAAGGDERPCGRHLHSDHAESRHAARRRISGPPGVQRSAGQRLRNRLPTRALPDRPAAQSAHHRAGDGHCAGCVRSRHHCLYRRLHYLVVMGETQHPCGFQIAEVHRGEPRTPVGPRSTPSRRTFGRYLDGGLRRFVGLPPLRSRGCSGPCHHFSADQQAVQRGPKILAVTTPQHHGQANAVKISKATVATRTSPKP
jgi:hypothetical protein